MNGTEIKFASKLINPNWSSREQDMFEHWDVEGGFLNSRFKFDVKGMKKFNRFDDYVQDQMCLVELVNVRGNPGWIKGKADYISFERKNYWLVVNREELLKMVEKNLGEPAEWSRTKKPYAIYDRKKYGKQDQFCWVPFDDIEELEDVHKVNHE